MVESLTMRADYSSWALWRPDGSNLDPTTLPILPSLTQRLNDWAAQYDATLNDDYPPDSGFPTPEAAEAFDRAGRELWMELQVELGDGYRITYFSDTEQRVL